MRLVHIGFGKTGTTTLQNNIFPNICKQLQIPYLEYETYYEKNNFKKIDCSPLEGRNFKPLPKNFIMSSESLIGEKWQMREMVGAFEINKLFFDKECQILIVIRKPSDIFNSIYIQNIHNFNIVKEENFFINKDEKNLNEEDRNKFNLKDFSFKKIIDLYKSHYKKVIVIKYENLDNFKFISELVPKNKTLNNVYLKGKFSRRFNKSFSKLGVKIFFILNKFFNLENLQIWVEKKITPNPKKLHHKIKNKLLAQLNLRNKIHNIDSLNIFYSKYQIKLKNLPIDVEKLDKEYKNITF